MRVVKSRKVKPMTRWMKRRIQKSRARCHMNETSRVGANVENEVEVKGSDESKEKSFTVKRGAAPALQG